MMALPEEAETKMTEAERAFHLLGACFPEAELSSLFGKICYKSDKKAFICFFRECLVAKLDGPDHTRAIGLPGATLFDPSGKGRPMKAWVQIPFNMHSEWSHMAQSAHHAIIQT